MVLRIDSRRRPRLPVVAALLLLSAAAGAAPQPPVAVTVRVDAGHVLHAVDPRLGGVNTAVWDSRLGSLATATLLRRAGIRALRFPGGSLSDRYDWSTARSIGVARPWPSTARTFARLVARLNAAAYVTVNYGSGTPEEAAAWVAWADGSPSSPQPLGTDSRGRHWQTVGYWAALRASRPLAKDDGLNFLRAAHPAPYRWRYWEIGNEVYGRWETDRHGAAGSGLSGRPHDPETYATEAAGFIRRMKAVDPSVEVGVVVRGDDDDGWNLSVLGRLSRLGLRPDFLSVHMYPQTPGHESDAGLLDAAARWNAVGRELRRQLGRFWPGSPVELAATEVNSVTSRPGKQSVGLVNALFYADTLGALATAGFDALDWYTLRASETAGGNRSSALYGDADYGSYALVSDGVGPAGVEVPPADTPFPSYRVLAQLAPWRSDRARQVAAGSGDARLAVYATRHADRSLTVMMINKHPDAAIAANVRLLGFKPGGRATLSIYGMPQARRMGPPSRSDPKLGAGAPPLNIPPYSCALLTLRSD